MRIPPQRRLEFLDLKTSTSLASDLKIAIIVKHRYKPNEVAAMDLVGDVRGRVCVLVDDMTDTCGTLLKAAGMLRVQGAAAPA